MHLFLSTLFLLGEWSTTTAWCVHMCVGRISQVLQGAQLYLLGQGFKMTPRCFLSYVSFFLWWGHSTTKLVWQEAGEADRLEAAIWCFPEFRHRANHTFQVLKMQSDFLFCQIFFTHTKWLEISEAYLPPQVFNSLTLSLTLQLSLLVFKSTLYKWSSPLVCSATFILPLQILSWLEESRPRRGLGEWTWQQPKGKQPPPTPTPRPPHVLHIACFPWVHISVLRSGVLGLSRLLVWTPKLLLSCCLIPEVSSHILKHPRVYWWFNINTFGLGIHSRQSESTICTLWVLMRNSLSLVFGCPTRD